LESSIQKIKEKHPKKSAGKTWCWSWWPRYGTHLDVYMGSAWGEENKEEKGMFE